MGHGNLRYAPRAGSNVLTDPRWLARLARRSEGGEMGCEGRAGAREGKQRGSRKTNNHVQARD